MVLAVLFQTAAAAGNDRWPTIPMPDGIAALYVGTKGPSEDLGK